MGEGEFKEYVEVSDTTKCSINIHSEIVNQKEKTYENTVNNRTISDIQEEFTGKEFHEVLSACILYAVNKFRKSKGLNDLVSNSTLSKSAKGQAQYLVDYNKTGHAGLNYTEYEWKNRIKEVFKANQEKIVEPTGENNARDVEQTTISRIMEKRIASPGHLATLISDSKYLGIGYASDPKTGRSVMVIETAK